MELQAAAVFAVVRVLAVRQVLGHQAQSSGGERSTDQVQHQDTLDLQHNTSRGDVNLKALEDGRALSHSVDYGDPVW